MGSITFEFYSYYEYVFDSSEAEVTYDGAEIEVTAAFCQLLDMNPVAANKMLDRGHLEGSLPQGMLVSDGKILRPDSLLCDGDRLKIFPRVCGG